MKVTIKAQKETPHPIKVKVCRVSSSLAVLCSSHETTEDTKPPKLTTGSLQLWHAPHGAAETGSSLTCISYTCSSTAKFVVWLQKQAVESERDVTTWQPAVDHIPPASGLMCSKEMENTWKLSSTSTESQGIKGISFSQKQQSRDEEEDLRDSFSYGPSFGSPCVLADLLYPSDMHKKGSLVSMSALKSTVQPPLL